MSTPLFGFYSASKTADRPPPGYNPEMKSFIQSYENRTMLDSSILIAPLVFFLTPNEPRFLNTLDRILLPPEKGGLTSTGLVYRYDTELSEDGIGGREGAFSMCTFWLVEAMTRASVYEPKYLIRAVNMFENMLSFSNRTCCSTPRVFFFVICLWSCVSRRSAPPESCDTARRPGSFDIAFHKANTD